MLRNLLFFFFALTIASTAQAQSFPQPSDVPDYVPVAMTYAAGTDPNCLGSQTVVAGECSGPADGGTMPVEAYALDDISLVDLGYPNELVGLNTGTYGEAQGYKAMPEDGGTGAEMKFRAVLTPTVISYDDPIRNWCQPGEAHLHQFFGAGRPSACSTYASLRRDAQYSEASGGPQNGTGYWFPPPIIPNAFGDGRDYVPTPRYVVIYYQEDKAFRGTVKMLPFGARYVTGFNMDVGTDLMNDAIAVANAQPGTSGRYRLRQDGTDYGGGAQLYCVGNATGLKFRTFADLTATECPAGGDVVIDFSGSKCYDGVNLWSPGGYKHVVPEIWDTVENEPVCPTGWYRIAALQVKVFYKHEGVSGARGLNNWNLSCTGMGAHAGREEDEMCFHTDWMFGWNGATWIELNENCLGVNDVAPHECNTHLISGTHELDYTSTYLTEFTGDTSTPDQMTPVPTRPDGVAHTAHVIQDNIIHVGEGDSITANSGSPTSRYGTDRPTLTVHYSTVVSGYGAVGGSGIDGMQTREADLIALDPKVVAVLIGANDLSNTTPYPTTQDWLDDLWSYTDDLRAAGIRVAVGTVLPIYLSGNPTATSTHNSRRATVNDAIRAAVGTHIDAYIDYDTTAVADEDTDAQNATYYSDGIHPTSAAYDIMEPVYRDVIDGLMGYTE